MRSIENGEPFANPEKPEPPCCEKSGDPGHLHLRPLDLLKTPEPEVMIPLTDEELDQLQALRSNAEQTGNDTWKIAKEGTHSAAMGGPIVVFYQDDAVQISAGAIVVGGGGDWGPTPVAESALLVAAAYNALPRLIAELRELRRKSSERSESDSEKVDEILHVIPAHPGWRGVFVSGDGAMDLVEVQIGAWACRRDDPTNLQPLFVGSNDDERLSRDECDRRPRGHAFVGVLGPGQTVDGDPAWERRIDLCAGEAEVALIQAKEEATAEKATWQRIDRASGAAPPSPRSRAFDVSTLCDFCGNAVVFACLEHGLGLCRDHRNEHTEDDCARAALKAAHP
jgi:hypothetical protein